MNVENEELFKIIFHSYSKCILRFLMLSVSSNEDAEDIFQEVFVACIKRFDDLSQNPDTDYQKWLFAVAKNQVSNYYKHKKRHVAPLSYDDADLHLVLSDDVDYISIISGNDLPPDEVIVTRILAELSESECALYDMVYIKNLKYNELAAALSVSEPAVRMRVYRMKQRVTDLLKKNLG